MSSVEKNDSAGQLNAGEEISGQFVVACGDSSKVLELVEEALDEIALTVEDKITSPRRLAVGFRRNHGGDFALGERIEQRVGVVRLVANQSLWISLLKQRLCASQIVRLPRREHHIDGIAEGIDKGVNFSGQSAAGSADRLLAVFFRAPALCWCARTMVASMIMYSLSCSLASSLKIRSKTPLFAHRLKR